MEDKDGVGKRKGNRGNRGSRSGTSASASGSGSHGGIVIMTYNVWFQESVQLRQRMDAVGSLILKHDPDVICFQEVTLNIYNIFQESAWWGKYSCSVSSSEAAQRPYFIMQMSRLPVRNIRRQPFANSQMGRELCVAVMTTASGGQLMVASSHLESPCPAPPAWNQFYCEERVAQATEALRGLKDAKNVVFCGDMNWDEKRDGAMPLPPGWHDAWEAIQQGQPGFTYDSKLNKMLEGDSLRLRVDRMLCHLRDFELQDVQLIGTEPLTGVTYQKEMKVKTQPQLVTLPVLPSDHFGLVLYLSKKGSASMRGRLAAMYSVMAALAPRNLLKVWFSGY